MNIEKRTYQHMRITKNLNKRIKLLAVVNDTTMIEILDRIVSEYED